MTSSGEKGERTRVVLARQLLLLPPFLPSSRSSHAACSELSVAQCGAEDLKGMRSAMQASPRVREEGRRGGRVGWS